MSRPETGPMRFADDWPGIFIRGDNAFGFALALEFALALQMPHGDAITEAELNFQSQRHLLEELRELLTSCIQEPIGPWDPDDPNSVQHAELR